MQKKARPRNETLVEFSSNTLRVKEIVIENTTDSSQDIRLNFSAVDDATFVSGTATRSFNEQPNVETAETINPFSPVEKKLSTRMNEQLEFHNWSDNETRTYGFSSHFLARERIKKWSFRLKRLMPGESLRVAWVSANGGMKAAIRGLGLRNRCDGCKLAMSTAMASFIAPYVAGGYLTTKAVDTLLSLDTVKKVIEKANRRLDLAIDTELMSETLQKLLTGLVSVNRSISAVLDFLAEIICRAMEMCSAREGRWA